MSPSTFKCYFMDFIGALTKNIKPIEMQMI